MFWSKELHDFWLGPIGRWWVLLAELKDSKGEKNIQSKMTSTIESI